MMFMISMLVLEIILGEVYTFFPLGKNEQPNIIDCVGYEKHVTYNIDSDDKYYKIKCGKYYFNEEQAGKIEYSIKRSEDWNNEPFNTRYLNNFKEDGEKGEVLNVNNGYYYIIAPFTGSKAERDREEINQTYYKGFRAAIYDDDENILYYYENNYENPYIL